VASTAGTLNLSELAAAHEYTFTSEEAQNAWDVSQGGELSDFELEMVSGGLGCS
tara:strand:+ start:1663 stop:1824 length:162 start_codon:yes stop_codon:yes gene_type:complete